MIFKKTRAIISPAVKVDLSFDEHRRVAAVVTILINIEKRAIANNRNTKEAITKTKIKRGSQYRGPLLFLITHALSLWELFKYFSSGTADDRHRSLILSQDSFQITDPDKFVPSARWITKSRPSAVHGIQSKQNPTKKELLAGIYKPRITLFYRPQGEKQVMLKVELSLPKLFFGNNFQELKQKDLRPLLQKLSSTLDQMGVIVDPSLLAAAPISAIHYSKNIPLTDGSTPYHYINKIKEANIQLNIDTNQTDYRNEGHSYKWHCNSYEVVFYDKIKDLEKARQSDKRAIEKDSALQLNLFSKFARRKKKLEILRIEVRLNNRRKIRPLFKKLNIKSDLTLKSIFKPAIAKKILLHYLDELESKRPALLDYKVTSGKALLADLIFNNPTIKPKQILQIYGLKQALGQMNLRELRGMLSKYKQRSWYRLMADAREVKLPGLYSPFGVIRDQIMKFKTLELR